MIPAEAIHDVRVLDRFSFVELDPEHAEQTVERLDGTKLRGKEIRLEVARVRSFAGRVASWPSPAGPGRLWPCPRRPGRAGLVRGEVQVRAEVGLTSRSVRKKPHLARSRDEDAGNSTPPYALGRFSGLKTDPETRCRLQGPYKGPNRCSDELTVVQHARKRGLPTFAVTTCESREGSVGPLVSPRRPSTRTGVPTDPLSRGWRQPARAVADMAASLSRTLQSNSQRRGRC